MQAETRFTPFFISLLPARALKHAAHSEFHWRKIALCSLRSMLCVPCDLCDKPAFVSSSVSFECLLQLQLKNRQWQVADSPALESTRSRIEDGNCGRVLRHRFHTGSSVSRDSKRSL